MVLRRHLVLGMIRRGRTVLRMVVRFGRLLRLHRRQQKAQRQRERAKSTVAPARIYKVTHLILWIPMSSCPVRAADEGSQATSTDAAGSDDALGYPGINRDSVPGACVVVAGEHMGRDRQDHGGIRRGHDGIRHRAHGTALHAVVVIGRGRAWIVYRVLSMHCVMIVFAVPGGLGVMVRSV
jgi:hypothetical protein